MPNCAIGNCKNTSRVVSRVNGNVSFHRFPSDPKTKSKWIDATGHKDWFPTKHSTICSLHFKEEDYIITNSSRRLFGTAYPTIQVLKTTSSEYNIDEPSTSKDEDDDDDEGEEEEDDEEEEEEEDEEEKQWSKNVNVKSTANKKSLLESPRKTIMILRKIVKAQKLKIKRLHGKNRRKANKIIALEGKIACLQKKSLKEEMTESIEDLTNEELIGSVVTYMSVGSNDI